MADLDDAQLSVESKPYSALLLEQRQAQPTLSVNAVSHAKPKLNREVFAGINGLSILSYIG